MRSDSDDSALCGIEAHLPCFLPLFQCGDAIYDAGYAVYHGLSGSP